MKTGTCYFPSYGAALRHYRPYDPGISMAELRQWIDEKLNAGEIHIGKPPLKPGERLTIEDNRYHVTEVTP